MSLALLVVLMPALCLRWEDGFKQDELESLFKQVKIKQKIINAMSRPAEKSKAWYEYRKIFLTDKRIKQGVKFWQENSNVLKYG